MMYEPFRPSVRFDLITLLRYCTADVFSDCSSEMTMEYKGKVSRPDAMGPVQLPMARLMPAGPHYYSPAVAITRLETES